MIKISKRLELISSLIPLNSKIIDIGCDHALLDIYVYQNNITKDILIADINSNALSGGIKNLEKNHLENNINYILSDGLDNIETNNKDTIIISGMGTNTIINILNKNKNKNKLKSIETLIIQSNTQIYELRKNIISLGYYISNEIILKEDNKYYIIIKFNKGFKKYSTKELKYGPILLKNKNTILQEKITNELNTKIKIKNNLPQNKILTKLIMNREINELNKIKNQLNK